MKCDKMVQCPPQTQRRDHAELLNLVKTRQRGEWVTIAVVGGPVLGHTDEIAICQLVRSVLVSRHVGYQTWPDICCVHRLLWILKQIGFATAEQCEDFPSSQHHLFFA